ncbi:MAG: AMP-binding protein, partial [Bacteroidia bacterium]|nr:AMP-binding protein [Bacteroidia bacterium]
MNIVQHFYEAAEKHPESIALIEKGKTLRYKDFLSSVLAIRRGLEKQGVKPGDNIMVLIGLSGSLYAHILAVFSLGAAVVLVDSLKPKERVSYGFKKARCRFLLTT